MASLQQGTPAVGLKAVARLIAVDVGKEGDELGFQHVGLDREVQAAAHSLAQRVRLLEDQNRLARTVPCFASQAHS
jgi:hypothetical protein